MAPSTTTTTKTEASSATGAPPATKTTTDTFGTTVETTAAAKGDKTTTAVSTQSTATARIVSVPPVSIAGHFNFWASTKEGRSCAETYGSVGTVKEGVTYEFTPKDLERYSTQRYGLTYGVAVVPNKVMIVDRSFVSSSSVLPYVGYEAWGPSWAGAWVVAAGVGTAPASTQTASTTSSSATSPKATIATFSTAKRTPCRRARSCRSSSDTPQFLRFSA